jgi:hypothetical protein
MRGNITRRGKRSWRIKFDVGADERGNRQIRYVTVRGKRCDAEAELAGLLNDHNQGTLVNPNKVTVGEYLRSWLGNKTDITAVTHERYTEIIERRIVPTLGNIELQKLKPKHVHDWLSDLSKKGGRESRYGRRKITLPPSAVADLDRYHRQLGMATHPDALVFSNSDNSPIRPNAVSVQWNREIRRIKRVPPVVFHSLRHTHASALIRAGIDVVSVSRRLGHSSPVITLKVYAHLFGDEGDGRAAEAIERMLG